MEQTINTNFNLCEAGGYDPLHDINHEQLCYDPFWLYPEPTIEDWAALASITPLPENRP